MKKLIYTFLSVLLVAGTLTSCVEDTDYETPQISCEEPQIDANSITTISNVKQMWLAENLGSSDRNLVEFIDEDAAPLYIEGYVVSNDKTGNFYQELFIQDSPSNPTQAIKIAVGVSSLFTKYDVGRKIYVKLNGLVINVSHGEMVIGAKVNDQVDEMSSSMAGSHILRNCDAVDVEPLSLSSPNAISDGMLGMYVQFNNMQFTDDLINKTFVSPYEDYDTHRNMISCDDGTIIKLETSGYSSFKDNLLPFGKGSVKGIISRDYGDDFYVLRVNGIDAFSFNEARCDGVVLTPTMTLSELVNGQSGDLGFNDEIVEAYVVSNDAAGNFYKQIYVQDNIENPTVGLQILVDEYDLFARYPIGAKVYISTNGLYLGESYGVKSLGYFDGSYVSQIERDEIGNYLTYSGEQFNIVPLECEMNEQGAVMIEGTTNEAPKGVLIQLGNMQVTKSGVGSAYAYFTGTASSNKSLFNCVAESTIIMRNSGYSGFANEAFPEGQGMITAVLSSYSETPQLYIRDTNDVDFEGERCGLNCFNTNAGGSNIIFEDDFESYTTNTTNIGSWTNVNVNGGSNLFKVKSYGGEKYVQLGAYGSGEDPLEVWFVTPTIDMDASTDEILSFETKTGYNNGAALKVYASTDFTGDVTTATWMYIDAVFADGPSSGYGDFTPSGAIDVSCLDGDVHFAFKYFGGNDGVTTTFRIDDVMVTGN